MRFSFSPFRGLFWPGSFSRLFEFGFQKRCKGVQHVNLGESFPKSIYLQNLASIQPRTSPTISRFRALGNLNLNFEVSKRLFAAQTTSYRHTKASFGILALTDIAHKTPIVLPIVVRAMHQIRLWCIGRPIDNRVSELVPRIRIRPERLS